PLPPHSSPTRRSSDLAYDAVNRRVIDGLMIPYETVVTFRLGEVTKYITEVWPIGQVYTFYIVANRAAWNSLPADVRDIITEYLRSEEHTSELQSRENL